MSKKSLLVLNTPTTITIVSNSKCSDIRQKQAGHIYLIKPHSELEDFYILSTEIMDGCPYIHKIPTDDVYTCFWALYQATDAVDGVLLLCKERLDYFCSIIEFRDGEFYFKGEGNED